MRKIVLRWVIPAALVLAVSGLCLGLVSNAADPDDPEAQLAAMLPAEREYCERVLSKILTTSNEKDVEELLGKPSRDLWLKKNWWVKLGGKKDRVGVYFGLNSFAHTVVLDGGPGRFYYFLKLEKKRAGDEPKAAVRCANDR